MANIDSKVKTSFPASSNDQAKPFLFRRYNNLGVGEPIKKDTGMSADEYTAAIVGFSCKGGDIEEWGKSWNLISVIMNPPSETDKQSGNKNWWIQADFRTSEDESWTAVDVMFVRNEYCDKENYTYFDI